MSNSAINKEQHSRNMSVMSQANMRNEKNYTGAI